VSELWKRYAGRIDALSLRERVMVFSAAMVAVLALGFELMVAPEIAKQKRLSIAMTQKNTEMRAFEAQLAKLLATRQQDPDRAERERLAKLKGELGVLEARVSAEERKFTAPAQMRTVVEGLLRRARGVQLVEMKTLAVSTVTSSKAGAKPPAKPPAEKVAERPPGAERLIYRHGLELTVSGSYLELLAYARELEQLPSQLYWGVLHVDAAGYPRVVMKLTVYTLSLDPTWLSV
jgi:MSHA biogenesis protein MshJ